MIAVIFEAIPRAGQKEAYLDAAARLRPLLANLDGFISIERFESITQPGKILSLSLWRDEAAVSAWRNVEAHREVQAEGRDRIFENYRIRVANVQRDYAFSKRDDAETQIAYPDVT